MSSLSIFRYEGADVRTIVIDGEPWFVAKDVGVVLGYADTTNAIKQHCRGVAKHHPITDALGRSQMVRVIAEPDLMRMIVSSKLPEAQEFERMVFEEILPAIRKTGSYTAAPVLSDDEIVHQALAITVRRVEALESHVAELTPRAEAWDELAAADGDYSIADAAKMLARAGITTGPLRLFSELQAMRWTFRGRDGKWHAYADKVDDGYLAERPQSHVNPKTKDVVIDAPQVRLTMRGIERLRVRLGDLTAVSR